MSAQTTLTPPPLATAAAQSSMPKWLRILSLAVGMFVLVSLVRSLTGANDLTSGGQINAAITLAVPIGLAALGGLWAERAGVVNIGLEGMMIMGTWSGAYAGLTAGSAWAALIGGMIGGALGGLVHAIATVSFGVDHIVSGVAINIISLGLARYLAVATFGNPTQSPDLPKLGVAAIPFLNDPLQQLENTHLFLLADLAGLLRGITSGLSWFTIIAIVLVPVSFVVLWRTSFGLRLRSCGESPIAAESLGVNVYRMKYIAVIISGAFAGLGGAFLVTVASTIYREGQTGGRGYIGLAAMIFGNWRPGGLAGGAALFGFTDALQFRQAASVHALLLLVGLLMLAFSGWNLWRRRWIRGGIGAVVAVLFVLAFVFIQTIPPQLVTYTPHIITLLVLALASQRLRMPASAGTVYRRGQGG